LRGVFCVLVFVGGGGVGCVVGCFACPVGFSSFVFLIRHWIIALSSPAFVGFHAQGGVAAILEICSRERYWIEVLWERKELN